MTEPHVLDIGKGRYANTPLFPVDFVQQIIVAFGQACGEEGYRPASGGGLAMTSERWDELRAALGKVVAHNVEIARHACDPDLQRANLERDRARAAVIAVAGKLAEALGVEAPPFEA